MDELAYVRMLDPVATVILLRHARSAANGSKTLAGRMPGVGLDETGTRQARGLPDRLSGIPLHAVTSSPLQRCRETLAELSEWHDVPITLEDRLAEVDYGQWTGRALNELAEEPLWRVVQQQPSAVTFPGGEGLAEVQNRAVAAIREIDARIERQYGPGAVWLACTHGDVIKAVLADALGLHLDGFQRIVVEPCSISVVRYTEARPFVLRLNDTGADLSGLVPDEQRTGGAADATVGGATGS